MNTLKISNKMESAKFIDMYIDDETHPALLMSCIMTITYMAKYGYRRVHKLFFRYCRTITDELTYKTFYLVIKSDDEFSNYIAFLYPYFQEASSIRQFKEIFINTGERGQSILNGSLLSCSSIHDIWHLMNNIHGNWPKLTDKGILSDDIFMYEDVSI